MKSDSRASEWRTIIVGLPIVRKLLNGEDVTIETFKVNLIPDDVLFNARPKHWDARLKEWVYDRRDGTARAKGKRVRTVNPTPAPKETK